MDPESAETVFCCNFIALTGVSELVFVILAARDGACDEPVHSCRQRPQGLPVDHVAGALPVLLHKQEPGIDQDFQMLRDRRLRQVELPHDILAAAAIRLGEIT